jgi:hypothetical protein
VQAPASAVRVLHANGFKLDAVDGVPRRQLFESRMRGGYGVELGVVVHARDKPRCSSMRSSMIASYGHLTVHMHEVASRRRTSALRGATVFDVQTQVLGYKLLPGGISYELGAEQLEEPAGPPRALLTLLLLLGPLGAEQVLSASAAVLCCTLGLLLLWSACGGCVARPKPAKHAKPRIRRASWPEWGQRVLAVAEGGVNWKRYRTGSMESVDGDVAAAGAATGAGRVRAKSDADGDKIK